MMEFRDKTKWLEVYDDQGEIVAEGSIKQVAEALRVCPTRVFQVMKGSRIKKKFEVCEVGVMRKLYDAYRGDCFLGTGTIEELAVITDYKIGSIKRTACISSHNRANGRKRESIQLLLFAHDEPRIDYY